MVEYPADFFDGQMASIGNSSRFAIRITVSSSKWQVIDAVLEVLRLASRTKEFQITDAPTDRNS